MSGVYKVLGTTRQACSRAARGADARADARAEAERGLLQEARRLRADHPAMGARKLHGMLRPEGTGRDRFEKLLLDNGLRVRKPQNFSRTTFGSRFHEYPNLLGGKVLTGINQLWASDITYFFVVRRFYYISFETDVYSRRIIGWHVSDNLLAASHLASLEMAFGVRGRSHYGGTLVHHSDKGSQYLSGLYLRALAERGCLVSTCGSVYENPYAERVNGTIKNEYLHFRKINTMSDLITETERAVHLYNHQRPHLGLMGSLAPVEFEKILPTLSAQTRPTVALYTEG